MWKKIRPTVQNALVQALFWGSYCALYSFASVFLLDRGVSNGQIGLILAAGNALSVILQPLIGNIADRSRKMILRLLVALCVVPIIGLSVILGMGGNSPLLYVLLVALLQTTLPLLYSLCAFFMDRGVNINFGLSRGIGSLGYAVLSSILGVVVAKTGASALMWVGIGLLVLLLGAVFRYRFPGVSEEKPVIEKNRTGSSGFLRENRRFLITLLGAVLLYSGFCMIGNYMFQIVTSIGLTSVEMGYAITAAAVAELPTLFLLAWLNRRFCSGHLMKFAAVFMAVKLFIVLLSRGFGGIMLACCTQFAGFALYAGISVYYVTHVVEVKHLALGQALMNCATTLGNLTACLVGGWLLDAAGVPMMLKVSCTFAAAGALTILLAAPRGKKLPAPVE